MYEDWKKYGNLCALQHLSKTKKEWKKEKIKMFLYPSSVPSLLAISSVDSGRLWLLCVCLRYGLGCTLGDRPLHTFLCSPPASLGRWTNWFGRWLFKGHISQLLTGFSPPTHLLSFLRICLSRTHTHIQLPLCRMQLKETRGSCSSRLCLESDCTVADQRCNLSP